MAESQMRAEVVGKAARLEAVLKDLTPRERELVEDLLQDYPSLTPEEPYSS